MSKKTKELNEEQVELFNVGKYWFSRGKDNKGEWFLWMSKEDGEAMGISEKELDIIWKEKY